MATPIHHDGFTDVDCSNCQECIRKTMPDAIAIFERLAQAGFPLDEHVQNAKANIEWARGLLRTYAPSQLPQDV